MIDEPNGNNIILPSPMAMSTTDDQSLSNSEYTDADESMSAPTEFLAEFLSSVMLKDYKNALKYCKLILQFEPNNATAKEFYPLIEEKMKLLADKPSSSDSDGNYKNASNTAAVKFGNNIPGNNNNCNMITGITIDTSDTDYSNGNSDSDEKELDLLNINTSNTSTSGNENTSHSYASSLLEEEEEDDEDDDDDEDEDDGDDAEIFPINSSKDVHINCNFIDDEDDDDDDDDDDDQDDDEDYGDENDNYGDVDENNNDSDLIDEDNEEYEFDDGGDNLHSLQKVVTGKMYQTPTDLSDLNNGNYKSASCSDSESPTEPLTQRLAAILKSKITSSSNISPSNNTNNNHHIFP